MSMSNLKLRNRSTQRASASLAGKLTHTHTPQVNGVASGTIRSQGLSMGSIVFVH